MLAKRKNAVFHLSDPEASSVFNTHSQRYAAVQIAFWWDLILLHFSRLDFKDIAE